MKESNSSKPINRYSILISGVVILASFGSVYAWSFFTIPLSEGYLWSKMQISIVFSLAVAGLGFGAAYTGPLVSKLGSPLLMKRAAILFVGGYLIAALGLYLGSGVLGPIETPWINWLSYIVLAVGYGLVGGIGLGSGYVTAVTTVAGWFPDKKGFATGIIVMGFGLGALFMSKIFAPISMNITSNNVAATFLIIAAVYTVIITISLRFIQSPSFAKNADSKMTVAERFKQGKGTRIRLWIICFLNSMAGIGILSLMSPLMQDVKAADNPELSASDLAAAGATLIAMASIGNSVGRLFWAWISDLIGRINTFVILLGSSAIIFLILPIVSSPLIYAILISYTIASYGGGFGTIPSFISDLFGPKNMSAIHGLVLTGWAVAGLITPTLFGHMYDVNPENAAIYGYYICAGALTVSTIMIITFRKMHKKCIRTV